MKKIAKVCYGAVLFVVCAFVLRDLFVQQWPTRSTVYANEEYQALTLAVLEAEIDELKAMNAEQDIRLDNLRLHRLRHHAALRFWQYHASCSAIRAMEKEMGKYALLPPPEDPATNNRMHRLYMANWQWCWRYLAACNGVKDILDGKKDDDIGL